ncbi:MAG: hypothetical protein ABF780_03350 [Bifidobacterium aquikefiri]|uniref:hypothetical protein n=1 Tax=Bifidobacterium aquikefiri TaxID=1653207 RepID=UPI000B9A2CEA|nr:hypothetical protein [Bifidobacterium aquikefiri]
MVNWGKDGIENYEFIKSKIASEALAKKEFAKSIWFEKNKIAISDDYKAIAQEQKPAASEAASKSADTKKQ